MAKFVKKNQSVKPLTLPDKKSREVGLNIFCKECRTWITNSVEACIHPESQQYKALVHVPGTQNKTKSKVFKTRDYYEAVHQKRDFENNLRLNNFNENFDTSNQPKKLASFIADYIEFLKGEGEHADKSNGMRSVEHRKQVKRILDRFTNFLEGKKYVTKSLLMSNISELMIRGFLAQYRSSPSVFNRSLSVLRTFFSEANKLANIRMDNPTNGYQMKPIQYSPESINFDELIQLLDKITPENGVCQCSFKSKKVAYYYTPWLSDAIKLICFTGRRRKDIFGAKFSDIIENNDGIPVVLNMGNTKVELKKKKRKIVDPVGIFPEFREFIFEIGYEKYKGTDRFLIGHEDSEKYFVTNEKKKWTAYQNLMYYREILMTSHLSKAFSHYYSLLKTGSELQLNSVRKTNLTKMKIINNASLAEISGHAGRGVLDKHYLDRLPTALEMAQRDIRMFGN